MDRESRFRFALDEVISRGEMIGARIIAKKYRLSFYQGYIIMKENNLINGQHLVNNNKVLITEDKL